MTSEFIDKGSCACLYVGGGGLPVVGLCLLKAKGN